MSRISLSDAKPISFQDVTAFWTQLAEASSHQNVGFFRTTYLGSGPIYVISLHHSVRMIPFVRTQEELFEATAKRASKLHKLRVVINGGAIVKSGVWPFRLRPVFDPVGQVRHP